MRFAKFVIAWRKDPVHSFRSHTLSHGFQLSESVYTIMIVGSQTYNNRLCRQVFVGKLAIPLPGVVATNAVTHTLFAKVGSANRNAIT
jgi:hypothetical protein